MGTEITAELEDAAQVDLQDLVPVRIWELVRRMSFLDSGAGEENMYTRDDRENFGGYVCHGFRRREVGGNDLGLAADGFNLGFCLLVGGISLEVYEIVKHPLQAALDST